MRREIDVRVEELVLEGVSPSAGPRVADAVRHELTRLARDAGFAGRESWEADHVAVDSTPAPGESAEALGARVARAVHGALQG